MPAIKIPGTEILHRSDHSKDVIFKQFKKYLNYRASRDHDATESYDSFFPFNNNEGICSGEVAYALYLIRNDEIGKFIARLHYVATWNLDKFRRGGEKRDPKLEEFISPIFFLHHHAQLAKGIQRYDLDKSLNMALGENMELVAPREYSISFVFNIPTLTDLLQKSAHPNKMLRFSNALHTVGAIQIDGIYYFIDPSQNPVLQATDNPKELAQLIFKGLAKFCHSKEYIALNMMVFDLEGAPKAEYPEKEQYCKNLMLQPKYQQAVLGHKNILRVGLRHDIGMLDFLFENGYVPKTLTEYDSELEESMAEDDLDKIAYLLIREIDVNAKGSKGETPIGYAIKYNLHKMLFLLLSNGADPDLKFARHTPLESAVEQQNIKAIVILLAFGATITTKIAKDKLLERCQIPAHQLRTKYATTPTMSKDDRKVLIFSHLELSNLQERIDADSKFKKDIVPMLRL